MRKRVLVLIFVLAAAALATSPEEVPNPRSRGSWVVDLAAVLSPQAQQRLNELSDKLQSTNGTQLAVVVLRATDRTPKAFATELFNRWGIGQRGLDNGVLVLVVMDQHRIEVEVGDGARRFMDDTQTAGILQSHFIPQFKAGRPEAGILAGVERICTQLATARYVARARLSTQPSVADYSDVLSREIKTNLLQRADGLYAQRGVELKLAVRPKNKSAESEFRHAGLGSNGVMALISTATGQVEVCAGADIPALDLAKAKKLAQSKEWNQCAGVLMGSVEDASETLRVGPLSSELQAPPPVRPQPAVARSQPPRAAGGSLSGVVLWGAAGAAGAGAFALAAWYRRRPRKCTQCGTRKILLDEASEDEFLSREDQLEESLGSVSYDAWLCPNCTHVHVERYGAWLSSYASCGSCSRRTLEVQTSTVEYPTEYSSGRGRREENCRNCSYSHTSYYTIPRKERSESSSSSSNSSSSSSSGFGGGSSSGGGSGASW